MALFESSRSDFSSGAKLFCAPLPSIAVCKAESPSETIDQNIRRTLQNPRLFDLYHAPDRDFEVIDDILKNASGESLFPDGEKNARFLKFKTMIAVRCATAFVVGDNKLKFSKVGKCTHLLEAAVIALNMRSILPQVQNYAMTRAEAIKNNCLPAYEFMHDETVTDEQKREIIAFVAYTHDHQEDFLKKYPFMTAEYLVKNCWLPFCTPENRNHAEYVTYLLHQLTDPPESRQWSPHKRLQLQLKRALADPSGVVGMIRDAEKTAMLARDDYAYEQNPSPQLLKKIRKDGSILWFSTPQPRFFTIMKRFCMSLRTRLAKSWT
ncbi:MAG: hypothetical protein PHD48_10430 [Alphaproteobacteria bacterium]|nr:hypothetical protein [Alphaproteobacteria bacterium]